MPATGLAVALVTLLVASLAIAVTAAVLVFMAFAVKLRLPAMMVAAWAAV